MLSNPSHFANVDRSSGSSPLTLVLRTPIFGIFGAVTWPWLQLHCLRGSSNLITLRVIVALAVLVSSPSAASLPAPVIVSLPSADL